MSKFRIVKIESTNGKGETTINYKIQKKFLAWFFDYSLTTHYSTIKDWNAHHWNKPNDMAFITKRYYIFDSLERVRVCCSKLESPFLEYYNGDLIKRVFGAHHLDDVFINLSYYAVKNNNFGYEFSDSLEKLKEMIDRRKIKVQHTIV